jgi:hypothetical protein
MFFLHGAAGKWDEIIIIVVFTATIIILFFLSWLRGRNIRKKKNN